MMTAMQTRAADAARGRCRVFGGAPGQGCPSPRPPGRGRTGLHPDLGAADAVVAGEPDEVYGPTWSADRAGDFRARWSAAAAVR